MGGCISWQRLIHRNYLLGDYLDISDASAPQDKARDALRAIIAGDARRMERDQRDERHLARYAAAAGITPEQAKAVLDLFLSVDCEGQTYA